MNTITIMVYLFSFLFIIISLIITGSQKKRLESVLLIALLFHYILIFVLESGVKYLFVIDNMKYEQDAWLTAKSWISNQPEIIALLTQTNLYTRFASTIFYLFGKSPMILTLFNSILGTFSIYFLVRLLRELFLANTDRQLQERASVAFTVLISMYPSHILWTTTNTKDPMTILFSVMGLFLFFKGTQGHLPKGKRGLFFLLAVICFYFEYQLRPYVVGLMAVGLICGYLYLFFSRYLSQKNLVLLFSCLILIGFGILDGLHLDFVATQLNLLFETRMSFSNVGLDDAAQSSFLLNYRFESAWDLLLFLPQTLSYYFFGPFPWQAVNARQVFSLIEPLVILIALPITLRGIRKAFILNRCVTVLGLTMISFVVLGQALTISNLGTIFRHRTFVLMFLGLFTVIGIYEKKTQSC